MAEKKKSRSLHQAVRSGELPLSQRVQAAADQPQIQAPQAGTRRHRLWRGARLLEPGGGDERQLTVSEPDPTSGHRDRH